MNYAEVVINIKSSPFCQTRRTPAFYLCASRRPGRGRERLGTTMGGVRKEKNTKSWLSQIWQVCNVFMSLFFALATYVQVSVWFVPSVSLHHLNSWSLTKDQCCALTSDQWSRRRVVDGKITITPRISFFALRDLSFHHVSVAGGLWSSCSPVCFYWLEPSCDR